MEGMESITFEKNLNAINNLIDGIRNHLTSALELSGDSVGTYVGGIIGGISSEYVDLIIKALLLIKYHLYEIKKHLNTFQEKNELSKVFVGIQNTIDQLNEIRIKSWFIQMEFWFLIEEIQDYAKEMLENFSIYA